MNNKKNIENGQRLYETRARPSGIKTGRKRGRKIQRETIINRHTWSAGNINNNNNLIRLSSDRQTCIIMTVNARNRYDIYTIILLKSVCRCSQTAGRNYCTIVSGNVSNCSYRLTVYPVRSSRLNSA